ncbi:hypothetical protein MRGA327_06555 [Mycobacterium tuberculosis RGTB327]|nr:hypothetical protein MRGA327_06555 [Mycobacterium tuberculosis RGTB327]
MAIWDRLVEVAAEQHGYVTTRDARDIGVDPVQLRLLAGRGRLERVGRGVYRVPVLPRGEHDDLAAAVSWTLGRGVISHESALALHALADVNPSRIHLTVPRNNHPRAPGASCTEFTAATSRQPTSLRSTEYPSRRLRAPSKTA